LIVGFDATDLSPKLGKHLANVLDNEEVEFRFHDLAAKNIQDALKLWRSATKWVSTNKPGVHAWASPRREMTDEQWDRFWLSFEREIGIEGEPHVEATHLKIGKGGRVVRHKHRIYLRLNPNGTALRLNHCAARAEKLARITEFDCGEPLVRGRFNRSVIAHLREEGRLEVAEAMEAAGLHLAERPAATSRKERSQTNRLEDISATEAKRRAYVAWSGSSNCIELEKNLAKQGLHIALGDTGRAVILSERGSIYRLSAAVSSGAKALRAPKVRAADVHALTAELSLQPVDVVKVNLPKVPPVTGWSAITGAERSIPLLSINDTTPTAMPAAKQTAQNLDFEEKREQRTAAPADIPASNIDPTNVTFNPISVQNSRSRPGNQHAFEIQAEPDWRAHFSESEIVVPEVGLAKPLPDLDMPLVPIASGIEHEIASSKKSAPEAVQFDEPLTMEIQQARVSRHEATLAAQPRVQPVPLETLSTAQLEVLAETGKELDAIIFGLGSVENVAELPAEVVEVESSEVSPPQELRGVGSAPKSKRQEQAVSFSIRAEPPFDPAHFEFNPKWLITTNGYYIDAVERMGKDDWGIERGGWNVQLKDGSMLSVLHNVFTVELAPDASLEDALEVAGAVFNQTKAAAAMVSASPENLTEMIARAAVRGHLPVSNENLFLVVKDEEIAMYVEMTEMADRTGGGEFYDACLHHLQSILQMVLYLENTHFVDLVKRNGAEEYLTKEQAMWFEKLATPEQLVPDARAIRPTAEREYDIRPDPKF
jgi:hypothetical protein